MAVIDSKARVFGVKSLRVVDASSFPILPPGHPSSTICKFELSRLIYCVKLDLADAE
jgi:choline dehydrogenase